MLDESQVKMLQQRQKIKMFFGPPPQVVETVNQWVENNPIHVIEQQIKEVESNIVLSVVYISNFKPAASAQTLPPAKGQHPHFNIEAIKAAYEQS